MCYKFERNSWAVFFSIKIGPGKSDWDWIENGKFGGKVFHFLIQLKISVPSFFRGFICFAEWNKFDNICWPYLPWETWMYVFQLDQTSSKKNKTEWGTNMEIFRNLRWIKLAESLSGLACNKFFQDQRSFGMLEGFRSAAIIKYENSFTPNCLAWFCLVDTALNL